MVALGGNGPSKTKTLSAGTAGTAAPLARVAHAARGERSALAMSIFGTSRCLYSQSLEKIDLLVMEAFEEIGCSASVGGDQISEWIHAFKSCILGSKTLPQGSK